MNVVVIGPEGCGKSTFAALMAKKMANGRPIYIAGGEKTSFQKIEIEQWAGIRNGVVIMDDASAIFDDYDLRRKENKEMHSSIFKSRHRMRVNIYVFHTIDDAVKKLLRASKFWYVSKQHPDDSYQRQYLRGKIPYEVGRGKHVFLAFQRF